MRCQRKLTIAEPKAWVILETVESLGPYLLRRPLPLHLSTPAGQPIEVMEGQDARTGIPVLAYRPVEGSLPPRVVGTLAWIEAIEGAWVAELPMGAVQASRYRGEAELSRLQHWTLSLLETLGALQTLGQSHGALAPERLWVKGNKVWLEGFGLKPSDPRPDPESLLQTLLELAGPLWAAWPYAKALEDWAKGQLDPLVLLDAMRNNLPVPPSTPVGSSVKVHAIEPLPNTVPTPPPSLETSTFAQPIPEEPAPLSEDPAPQLHPNPSPLAAEPQTLEVDSKPVQLEQPLDEPVSAPLPQPSPEPVSAPHPADFTPYLDQPIQAEPAIPAPPEPEVAKTEPPLQSELATTEPPLQSEVAKTEPPLQSEVAKTEPPPQPTFPETLLSGESKPTIDASWVLPNELTPPPEPAPTSQPAEPTPPASPKLPPGLSKPAIRVLVTDDSETPLEEVPLKRIRIDEPIEPSFPVYSPPSPSRRSFMWWGIVVGILVLLGAITAFGLWPREQRPSASGYVVSFRVQPENLTARLELLDAPPNSRLRERLGQVIAQIPGPVSFDVAGDYRLRIRAAGREPREYVLTVPRPNAVLIRLQ